MFLLALTLKLYLDPARLADALTHVDLIVFDELGYLPRDPACTQRTGLHDVTPCHRRRPLGSAGVGLAVLQSANLCG